MLPLRRVLLDYDLGLLRVIAGQWGVELLAGDTRAAADELASALLRPEHLGEMLSALPAEGRAALDHLLAAGGSLPVAQLTRQFGEVRPMGPARRDRKQPWLAPASPLELLWYRGLIGRAFGEAKPVPQEFFFVPSDLLALLPQPAPAPEAAPGEAAPAPENPVLAGCAILDDACTALAYLQTMPQDAALRRRLSLTQFLLHPDSMEFVLHLIGRLGLAGGSPLKPDPAKTRPFLEAPQAQQHLRLAEAWQTDPTWNELSHVESLLLGRAKEDESTLPNDPLVARQAILSLLTYVPIGEWWSLESFVLTMKERAPDFQRPAGDYDSWYLRDAATGEFLRGFEPWERVEGALIRYVICGPLHWLGLADIGSGKVDRRRGASLHDVKFRLTRAARSFLHSAPWPADPPTAKLRISADGALTVPRPVSAYERFTAARIADWESVEADRPDRAVYRYRLSAGSLARAREQGVTVRHVLAFLSKAAANPVPKSLIAALERWEQAGTEAVLGDMMMLKVKSADVLDRLRASPKTKGFLGESLGALAVEVRRVHWEKLRAAMAEMGLLTEVRHR